MRADIRSGADATTRRTQPNWLLECLKVGIPMAQLPPTPAADASFKAKSQHTWELRRAWERKTGRQIERLTPPGYYDKIMERRRLANEARSVPNSVIDQIMADTHAFEARDLLRQAREEADAFIVEDIRQAEPFSQIDTRVSDPEADRLSRVSPTLPDGHRWIRDEDLPAEKAEARQMAIIARFSGAQWVPAGG